MSSPNVAAALWYLDKCGWSVIPVGQDKKPKLRWEEFETRRALDNEVRGWFQKWPDAGVGIVTGKISNLDVVDVDNSEKSSAAEGLERLKPYLCPTGVPTVHTPRGGMHLYFQHIEGMANKVDHPFGVDLRAEGGYVVAPPSFGANGVQYRWDELHRIGSIPIPSLPQPYVDMIMKSNGPVLNHQVDPTFPLTQGRRNNDLWHALYSMASLVTPEELKAYGRQLGASAQPPMDEREVDSIIGSVLKRAERKELNLAQEVEEYVSMTNGFFTVEAINRDFGFNGPFEKNNRANVSMILLRMQNKGLIEKYGERTGTYRKVDKSKSLIEWEGANAEPVPLLLPLDLNQLVYTLPKSIVCIAGFPSAGKTAFCLETIRLNQEAWKTIYMVSDLGPAELASRIKVFENIDPEEWNFEAVERSTAFADIVIPDGLNVIDYIRLDDHWKIAATLESIWNNLTTGVAIVCIQKEWGRVLGRGKEFSLEKPRLYLSMDPGKIRIIKAKTFLGQDPVGYARYFEIYNGWAFKPLGEWVYEPLSQDDFIKPWKQRRLF